MPLDDLSDLIRMGIDAFGGVDAEVEFQFGGAHSFVNVVPPLFNGGFQLRRL